VPGVAKSIREVRAVWRSAGEALAGRGLTTGRRGVFAARAAAGRRVVERVLALNRHRARPLGRRTRRFAGSITASGIGERRVALCPADVRAPGLLVPPFLEETLVPPRVMNMIFKRRTRPSAKWPWA
jgi:hypothetical protein